MTTIKRNKHKTIDEKIKITNYYEKHGYAKTIDKFNVSRSAIDCWMKLKNSSGITESKSGRTTKVESVGMEPFLSISKMTEEEERLAIEYFTSLVK